MKFNYKENGFEIVFDDKEKKIVSDIGKLTLDYVNAKHFVNHLSHVVTETHRKYLNSQGDKIKKQLTFEETKIETK